MEKIKNLILQLLSSPYFVNGGILAVSVISLAMALTAEHVFGLAPCILCIYQRVPFVITSVLALAGLGLSFKKPLYTAIPIALSAFAFLVNSGLAFYHSGVELKWWISVFDGCHVSAIAGSSENLLKAIQSAAAVPCDEIPWIDPVIGLSMANYNTVMCFCLAIGCGFCSYLIYKKYK